MKCGQTTQYKYCVLRISALQSFLGDEGIYKERIERPFFNQNYEKEIKTIRIQLDCSSMTIENI